MKETEVITTWEVCTLYDSNDTTFWARWICRDSTKSSGHQGLGREEGINTGAWAFKGSETTLFVTVLVEHGIMNVLTPVECTKSEYQHTFIYLINIKHQYWLINSNQFTTLTRGVNDRGHGVLGRREKVWWSSWYFLLNLPGNLQTALENKASAIFQKVCIWKQLRYYLVQFISVCKSMGMKLVCHLTESPPPFFFLNQPEFIHTCSRNPDLFHNLLARAIFSFSTCWWMGYLLKKNTGFTLIIYVHTGKWLHIFYVVIPSWSRGGI